MNLVKQKTAAGLEVSAKLPGIFPNRVFSGEVQRGAFIAFIRAKTA
jgi:hypothetical protein